MSSQLEYNQSIAMENANIAEEFTKQIQEEILMDLLEYDQSIEMENANIAEEILMEEKGKETSHPNISPQVQEVLDSIQDVPIEYLSLIKEFNWKQIKEMMEVLSNCACCERHQKNKPNISDLENGHRADYPLSGRKFSEDDCQCVCRQEARDFCRIINDPDYFDMHYHLSRWDDEREGPKCVMCKKEAIKKFHFDYCSLDCVNRDQSTWTDYGQSSDEESEEETNNCRECGIDMGPNNPRQLCGKTYCREMVPGYPEDQDYINIGEADYLLGNLTEEQMTIPPGSICASVSSSYASVACKRIVSFLTDPLQRIVTVGYSSGGAREHMLFRSECGEKLCIIYKTCDRGMRIYYLTREIIDGMVDGNPIAINWSDVEGGLKE